MLWVLIRIALPQQGDSNEQPQHRFSEDLTKIIFQLSSNFIKYTQYLFFWGEVYEQAKGGGYQEVSIGYRKVPKFWDAGNLYCNLPKIKTKRPNLKDILSKWCTWNSQQ